MKKIAYILLSGVLVFALFSRCVGFSYIGLDDAAYTFRNPFVAGGLSVPNVVEAFTNLRHGGIWMPVTYISYMLDASFCRISGIPLIAEMHFVNVILHTVNFLLLWKLLTLIFAWGTGNGERGMGNGEEGTSNSTQLSTLIAALAAMTWAVHPLRAEPVAWIAARKELLWSLFTLAGLIIWIKDLTVPHSPSFIPHSSSHSPLCVLCGSAGDKNKLLTMLFCAFACLSKPTAMCFPLLALLVVWFRLPQRRRDAETTGKDGVPSLSALAPLFIMAVVTAAIAAYSQTHVAGQDAVALYAAPISHRLVNALSAIGFYLRATFWPFGLHADCRAVPGLWPLDAGWNFAALGVAVLAVGFTRSTRLIIFATLWFLISLSPTLGLFGSFGVEAHADRFAYLPSMAFAFLIAGFAFARSAGRDGDGFDSRVERAERVDCGNREEGIGKRECSQIAIDTIVHRSQISSIAPRLCVSAGNENSQLPTLNSQLLTLIVLVLLSFATFQQLSYWRDDGAAHQRILDCDPGHPRAMVHVADARCSRQRDFDGGIRLYRKALSRTGTVPKGGFNVPDVKARLAYALASRGAYDDFAEVKRLGAEVLRDFRLDRRGMMLDALGTAFMAEGDSKRAALLFKASIDAPDRFWPKASTRRKLESCK